MSIIEKIFYKLILINLISIIYSEESYTFCKSYYGEDKS